MKFENPICLNCKTPLIREDIDMSNDIAICKQCNTIFKFSNLLYSGQDNSHKNKIEVHDGFLYEDFKLIPSIKIELKKMSNYKFQILFAFIVGAFAITLCIIPSFVAKLIACLLVLLATYLMKEGLYRMTTTYTIELEKGTLSVFRNGDQITKIQSDDIAQIFIKRRNGGSSGSTVYYEHDIYIRPKSGNDIKIIKHILPSAVAFRIERIIEEKYQIKDIICKEEYHPKYSPQAGLEESQKIADFAAKLYKNKQNKTEGK